MNLTPKQRKLVLKAIREFGQPPEVSWEQVYEQFCEKVLKGAVDFEHRQRVSLAILENKGCIEWTSDHKK